jgi:hypothetical protein
MADEYQKMYLIQDRLLGDMIRIVSPELIVETQQIRMVKIKGMEESQYYATPNSGLSAIFHIIYPHMRMTKDALNLLQRKIEAMARGFISGPILMRISDYMKLQQKEKAAKIAVSYHEVVRKSAMRIQSRLPVAYSVTSKFIESEDPKYTNDAIGMMDLFLGKISEMFRQHGMNDNPLTPPWRRLRKRYNPQAATNDDDDGILKVSRREHHCLMALALAAQLSTAVA